MYRIQINDLEVKNQPMFHNLTEEEMEEIIGGGWLGKLIGAVVGGVGGFFIGGPKGALSGVSGGASLGGAIEDAIRKK